MAWISARCLSRLLTPIRCGRPGTPLVDKQNLRGPVTPEVCYQVWPVADARLLPGVRFQAHDALFAHKRIVHNPRRQVEPVACLQYQAPA